MRLRSIYGSPNNVALYLGRIFPILIAMIMMGSGRRRLAYALAIVPIGLAILLTFSKGSLLIGLPASFIVVFIIWRRSLKGRIWPWLLGFAAAGILALIVALQIPQFAGRLNPQGETGLFRMNLWLASLNMIRDHPVFGVGLDNFLYAYRSRYILSAAWQEPNLSHPHNIILDFATRLGLVGLIAGTVMFIAFIQALWKLPSKVDDQWKPVSAGIAGSLIYLLAHGLVDHSFFIVDLAFAFMLLLGITVWLRQNRVINTN
jgi:O-antigen ligase